MQEITLYCKSYRTDLNRVLRLAASVRKHNRERLPFHISVPATDLELFRSHLKGDDVIFHADEEILETVPSGHEPVNPLLLPGSLMQQIVKSEFWRLGLSTTYVCLDSDAFFIRPFGRQDFLDADGTPYTVIDEAHEILEDAIAHRKPQVLSAYQADAREVQKLLGRTGRVYNFGPLPVIWHRDVWASLYDSFLAPRGMNFADAIRMAPSEARWYGESLLKYQAIRLLPCQAFFKVYHYAWQFDRDRRAGVKEINLAQLYCGVIYQSAWERSIDWPREGGSLGSRLGRRLRRILGRI